MLVIEGSRRMKTPVIFRQLEAYWEALRPVGDIPSRDTIDPRGFESVMDFAFLLEVSPNGEPVFRLTGERLGDLLGVSLDKVPMTALFKRECQPQVRNAMLSVFTSPGVLRAELTSEASISRPELTASLQVLPLRKLDGSITCALGALHFDRPVGRSPRQFSEMNHNLTRIVVDSQKYEAATNPSDYEIAEPTTEFIYEKRLPSEEGRPNLTIIKGGLG